MPATMELRCSNDDCELDMARLHFTYEMPNDVEPTDFACPYCGGTDCLEELVV